MFGKRYGVEISPRLNVWAVSMSLLGCMRRRDSIVEIRRTHESLRCESANIGLLPLAFSGFHDLLTRFNFDR